MFTKDSRAEQFLTRIGVTWAYTNEVGFDRLAPAWDMANMGRPKAKVEDIILEYAARTESGSAAPAPILWKKPGGYEILDGVQRLSAEQMLGTTRFSAYVIETDSGRVARLIRVASNQILAGTPPPAEWTRDQAIQLLVIQDGQSIEEVCRLFGWKVKSIEEHKKYLDRAFANRTRRTVGQEARRTDAAGPRVVGPRGSGRKRGPRPE